MKKIVRIWSIQVKYTLKHPHPHTHIHERIWIEHKQTQQQHYNNIIKKIMIITIEVKFNEEITMYEFKNKVKWNKCEINLNNSGWCGPVHFVSLPFPLQHKNSCVYSQKKQQKELHFRNPWQRCGKSFTLKYNHDIHTRTD